ncbi:hypothetical protein ABZ319_33075 [Nocardia sp. NPDC005978]|uniref:hypothetical protein n=1 Tax=Nocardia sp. NPDC005978 TaxID=3156725 RepID=UPI0033AA4A00
MEPAAGPAFGLGEPIVRVGCSPSGFLLPIANALGIAAAVWWLDDARLVLPEGWGGWGVALAFAGTGLLYALFGLGQLVVFMLSPVRIYVGGVSEIASNVLKCWLLTVVCKSVGYGVELRGVWTILWAGIIVAAVRFVFGARTGFED